MTERPPDPDDNRSPDDVAALYARANIQGTRYWDFSASRQEVQGQFRRRIAREHAERAAANFARQSFEQTTPRQFQMPPAEIPAPPRSGPVLAPEPEAPESPAVNQQPLTLTEPAVSQASHEEIAVLAGPQAVPAPRRDAPAEPAEATRWYALHTVLAPAATAVESSYAMALSEQRPPMVAVLSFAGGVGKTTLVATLGRALSSLGESVLLGDNNAGLLPFYYGARSSRPGVVRTFTPPVSPFRSESHVPVRLLSLQVDRYPVDGNYDPLLARLVRDGCGVSRILVDVGTADWNLATRLLAWRPTVLVPILPDLNSIASLEPLEALLADQQCFYLLNQFDPSSRLHLEVRTRLQQQLGERLLPVVVRRSESVSEALAEGLTVIDYASDAAVVDDYRRLADWLRDFALPAVLAGGVRWSER